jgi:hypothetical protein
MQSSTSDQSPGSLSATQRLATILLGQDVNEFIDSRREAGRPWRYIARDLYDATNGQIDVTYETLRNWRGSAA